MGMKRVSHGLGKRPCSGHAKTEFEAAGWPTSADMAEDGATTKETYKDQSVSATGPFKEAVVVEHRISLN